MKVLVAVEAVKIGETPDGAPVTEPVLPAFLRLDVAQGLAVPGTKMFVTVLVHVQAPLPG